MAGRALHGLYTSRADGRSVLGAVSASWQRSLTDFRLDPESPAAPYILTQRELRESREPLGDLVALARTDVDRLYAVVRDLNYVVLLTDTEGVAVDHRGDEGEAGAFKEWGIWLGGVWAEQMEGTNGIGTAISERRPVTVHQSQHFRVRNRSLSCAGVPLFSPDGTMLGVLDVSSMNPGLSEDAHALSLQVTINAARAIEERLFRDAYARLSVVSLAPLGQLPFLIAVDNDLRIIGADRMAREALKLDDGALRTGIGLWAFFDRSASVIEAGEARAARLRRINDDSPWHAIVTAPAAPLHGRTALLDLPASTSAQRQQGGLAPGALRRLKQYIEAHLSERISLKDLAAVASLSVWHFAHGFKQSVGDTPYGYVLGRRVERARQMLTCTDVSLAEIAQATGFADQSHLARHFRRRAGLTPHEVRRRPELGQAKNRNNGA
jgi:transcriptional regulator of acetoin/glycerol metabolism